MGWASGTNVFDSVWSKLRKYIPENKRVVACKALISALADEDWDCIDECVDPKWPETQTAVDQYFKENA